MTQAAGPASTSTTESAAELAARALQLAGSDPALATDTAYAALAAARASGQPAARTHAYRALGLAARATGHLEQAREHLVRAVRSAKASGDLVGGAEARMTLSFVLLDLGLISQALRQSTSAAAVLTGPAQWRLQAQRALVLQRCGRVSAALAVYDDVLPRLRAVGDGVWVARIATNRGIVHSILGDMRTAETDLVEAYQARQALGLELEAAQSLWNLGCLARERGDVVTALRRFDQAEDDLARLGTPPGTCWIDRASLLLSVGVVHEARELAERAHADFVTRHESAQTLETETLLARIALYDGDPEAALTWSAAARRRAAQQRRPAWALLARHLDVLAREAMSDSSARLCTSAEQIAQALARIGWVDSAVDAQLAAVRLATRAARHDRAARGLARAERWAGPDAPASWRLRHADALARSLAARGDDVAAARTVRQGLRLLARNRATLGTSDLQARIVATAESLARTGLRVALRSGSPRVVLREVERWRGLDVRAHPVRPPRDPALQSAVEQLRRAAAALREVESDAGDDERLRRQVAQRERVVQRLSRTTSAATWTPPQAVPDVSTLRAQLGERTLVQFVGLDGRLLAMSLAGTGRGPTLHELGELRPAAAALEHLQFALARCATGRGSRASLAAAVASAKASAQALDDVLLGPLRRGLPDAPLVIAPTEALHSVPWSMLPTAAAVAINVVRCGTAWLTATGNAEASAHQGRQVTVTGPQVSAAPAPTATRQTDQLAGPAATVAATLRLMEGAGIVHLAAHGTFRGDNPLLSSLRLADGDLTVYDLEQLTAPPRLVVLAACHSAVAEVLPGNQLLGVAHALQRLGTAGVVATTLPTPDAETAVLMAALHRELDRGRPAAEALRTARGELDLDDPAGMATAAGFAVYGR